MKKKLLALAFVSLGSLFAQVSLGIRIGPPPAPRVVRVHPVSPGPGYAWVDGYWYPVNGRYTWHDGYWSRPPYGGANWVAPRYEGGRYLDGHWGGSRGDVRHDHQWDRDRDHRDYDRYHDGDHHR